MHFKNTVCRFGFVGQFSKEEKKGKERERGGVDKQQRSLLGFKSGKLQLHGILLRPLGHESVCFVNI